MKFLADDANGFGTDFYADSWETAEKVCAAMGWRLFGVWVEDVHE